MIRTTLVIAAASLTIFGLSACSSSTPTPVAAPVTVAAPVQPVNTDAQNIVNWYATGGKLHVDTLTGDLLATAEAARQQNSTALVVMCNKLATDAAAAHNGIPVPVASVQYNWAQATSWFYQAGQQCMAGAASQNATLINQATQSTGYGAHYLNQATTEIQRVSQVTR